MRSVVIDCTVLDGWERGREREREREREGGEGEGVGERYLC